MKKLIAEYEKAQDGKYELLKRRLEGLREDVDKILAVLADEPNHYIVALLDNQLSEESRKIERHYSDIKLQDMLIYRLKIACEVPPDETNNS